MRKLITLLCVAAFVVAFAACDTAAPPAAGAGGGDGQLTFAIVLRSAGNPFMERMAYGFVNAAESLGHVAVTHYPEDMSAEAQITVINTLIAQGVDGIAVAANDPDAIESALNAARNQGIAVITLDGDAAGSQLFVNQAGVTEVAQALVGSVYDMTGGSGQFAVLSATSTSPNQNAWIAAMQEVIDGNPRYANLEWVATVFGDDEAQRSFDETQSLLINHPDLDVIVAPTTVSILAAAQVVQLQGSDVLIAGLGLPSEMLGLVGPGLPCPYMYLWNTIDLGHVGALALHAIHSGDTTGAAGESFTVSGRTFEIIAGIPDLGILSNQIIIGPPFRFYEGNIEYWAAIL
jgi:rhamnose transport system substrate-binding protein